MASKSNAQSPAKSLAAPSPLAVNTANFIAASRILVGVISVVAPQPFLKQFGLPVPDNLILLARLVGVRDVIIGGLLWTARKDDSTPAGRSEARRALWINVLTDSADSLSTVWAVATGLFSSADALAFFAVAVPFIGLGLFGLSSF